MRYWTENTELALANFANNGGNIVHLGSEAGQHIVGLKNNNDYHDGQIVLQPNSDFPNIGERLENNLFCATVSGSRKNGPWGSLSFTRKLRKHFKRLKIANGVVQGIAGLSWDKSLKSNDLIILAKSRIKHREWTYRVANSHLRVLDSGGSIFNAGVSSWTWGLEEFGNHGNALVSTNLQRITLELMGLDSNQEISGTETYEENDAKYDDLFTLDDFNIILQQNLGI